MQIINITLFISHKTCTFKYDSFTMHSGIEQDFTTLKYYCLYIFFETGIKIFTNFLNMTFLNMG